MAAIPDGLSETSASSKFGVRGAFANSYRPRWRFAGSGSRVAPKALPASPWGAVGLNQRKNGFGNFAWRLTKSTALLERTSVT